MKVKNISYPHPVLGNEDDVQGSFSVTSRHGLGRKKIRLTIEFKLENKTLEDMVKKKLAMYTIEVECSGTFYRKNFMIFDNKNPFIIEEDAHKMRGSVSVKFYIRANETIEKYEIEGCHSDYTGFQFSISKGDILAQGGKTLFSADKEFDPLKAAVSSFISVREDTKNADGPMVIDYDDPEKIYIKLSRKDWKKYQELKGTKWIAPIIHSSIVLPVLADALKIVIDNDSDRQGSRWFEMLNIILQQKSLMDDEPLIAAQKILDGPINRCFIGIAENTKDDFL